VFMDGGGLQPVACIVPAAAVLASHAAAPASQPPLTHTPVLALLTILLQGLLAYTIQPTFQFLCTLKFLPVVLRCPLLFSNHPTTQVAEPPEAAGCADAAYRAHAAAVAALHVAGV
jgi:hypothetical protein